MGGNVNTIVASLAIVLGAAPATGNNFTVVVAPAGGETATGAEFVVVEVFAFNTSGVDQPFVAAQLNFPCGLPRQPGATGFIGLGKCGTGATCNVGGTPCFNAADCPPPYGCSVVPASSGINCNEDSDCPTGETCFAAEALLVGGPEAVVSGNEPTSLNGIPRLFDGDDIAATSQSVCQLNLVSFPAGTNAILPAGTTRYIGATRYRVSNCATGGFRARLESFTDP
jgi:hypothetical protein